MTLGSTTYIYVSIRANVSGMTVPGDYVYQVNVTNPGHPDLTAQIVCTVHNATSAPVISSITATPPSVTLPVNAIQLSAVTSGSTNQPLRHWWAVKATPVGAHPLFDHQGRTNTTVSNLVLPGSYTFTLRAFDDLHMTTLDKTVTVSPTPGAPVITSPAADSVIVGLSYKYTVTASNGPAGYSIIGLPAGLSFSNGVISGNPSIAGSYNVQLERDQRERRGVWKSRVDGQAAVAGDHERADGGWVGECGFQLHHPVGECGDAFRRDRITGRVDGEFGHGGHHGDADELRSVPGHDQRREYHRPVHQQSDGGHL